MDRCRVTMRSIGKLSQRVAKWEKDLEKRLIAAQQNTAQKIWEDTVSQAPTRSGTYISSIQVSDTKVENGTITTSIFSDLLVGGDDPKWSKVPLGALLEWGTGIKGASTNKYPHGYGYRLTPWCYYDKYLHMFVTTDGMIARPHFYPSLIQNKKMYKEEIRKAVKLK